MSVTMQNRTYGDHERTGRRFAQRFPLRRALAGLSLVALTGFTAGLVALGIL